MRGLSAKNVIVTGGGGAIGGAICRRFAGYGACVGVFDKNLDGAALSYVDMTLMCVKCHQHVRETKMGE